MSSKALGQGAIVNVATIVGSTSDGRWTIFTSRGVLFAHVIETVQGTPTSIFISGTGTITGGTGRHKGAGGWLDADETPSQDFRSAAITLEGTIIYSR